MLAVHQLGQAVDARLGDHDDAAAVAAVAAVGPAARDVLLPAEAHAAIAAAARFDIDSDAINKHDYQANQKKQGCTNRRIPGDISAKTNAVESDQR
jgi:hypothetical protein